MSLCHRWAPTARALVRQLVSSPTAAPGSWQVSSHGRVSNLRGTISFGSSRASGYCDVMIEKERFFVHRVVAQTFLGPPPTKDVWQVHHRDGNPSNNHITNLEYVTCSQNHRHSHARGSRRCSGPTRWKPVMYRAVGCKAWTHCHSMTSAALELGVTPQAVSKACRRKMNLKDIEICFGHLHQPDLPGEKWRQMLCPVSGEAVLGRMVSSLGRLRMGSGHISSGCVRGGYPATRYSSILGYRSESVHRLVALAFLGPAPSCERWHVNHKDGDKANNTAANLEYVTPAENMAHYWKNRATQHERKLRSDSKPVWSRAFNSNNGWTWHQSTTSAAQVLGLRSGLISHCVNRRQRQTGGFEFRAADVFETLPGEEWREVDVPALIEEKRKRMQAHLTRPV